MGAASHLFPFARIPWLPTTTQALRAGQQHSESVAAVAVAVVVVAAENRTRRGSSFEKLVQETIAAAACYSSRSSLGLKSQVRAVALMQKNSHTRAALLVKKSQARALVGTKPKSQNGDSACGREKSMLYSWMRF